MTHRPVFSNVRRLLDVHVNVQGVPETYVGRHRTSTYGVTVTYRVLEPDGVWECIHVVINGTWLEGMSRGKLVRRRYGRKSLGRLPDWLLEFIENNNPGK